MGKRDEIVRVIDPEAFEDPALQDDLTTSPERLKELREEWRELYGYEISSLGRVRRCGKILKTPKDRYGYPRFSFRIGGKQTLRTVHSLVLEAFVGPRPEGMEIGHLDGTRDNNAVSNLAYVTSAENAAHSRIHGTVARGDRHGRAKLTSKAVAEIRNTHKMGCKKFGVRPLAKKFGVDPATIRRAIYGENWADLRRARTVYEGEE